SNISQVTSATHTNLFPLKGGTTTTARKAKDQFGPLGDYTSLSVGGLGYGFLNFNASTVVRGGLFNNLTTSGIFAVDLGIGPTTSSYGLGFRCVMHPKPFDTDFVDVTNATKSLSYTSNQLTASLISSSISASVAGDGSPVIIKNNINVGASTTIAPGDRVQIRLMSSSTDGSKVSAVLTANGKNFKYSVTTSEVSAFSCPTNYIRVPADSDYGTNDFCVMKYEAKLMYDSDGDGDFSNASIVADGNASNTYNYDTDYETPASLVKYKAVSEVSGKPWVYIRRGENGSATGQGALEACQRLNVQEGVTNKYDLITNSEWQIVARNIADQQSGATNNWGTDSYGHTVLNHGHADASPGSTCDAAQEYVDLNCSNSGGETDYEDKRTHNLSNSEVIWDFAGNAWEYVKENHTTTVYLGAASSDEWSVVLDGNADGLSDNYLPAQKDFGPIDLTPSVCTNPSANNKCGLGNIYDHTAGAIVRGNYALGGPGSGVFALYLNIGPTASNTYIGFRCVYHP
ncbi:MAG: hypothetical protein KDD50_02005, partial [Bdellovibrionales bacterium]|nr:hypothetical protein [Bdellovibrionales bacterium]